MLSRTRRRHHVCFQRPRDSLAKVFASFFKKKPFLRSIKSMPTLELIGAPWGNFVRTARMACAEKGVPYTLTIVRPQSPEVIAISPFGLVPCMRHGGLELCESRAICAYIDAAFEGPPLMPRDPAAMAVAEQWIALIMTTIDPVLARQYLVAYINAPGGVPEPGAIAALLPKMRECFNVLDRRLAQTPYLAGDAFTLADMFLYPLIWFMRLKPESAELLQASPHLLAWYEKLGARASVQESEPPAPAGAPAPCRT
jgi:glutathione S-transferase